MRKSLAAFLLAAIGAFAAPALAVTIEWIPVGNPGNAADTTVMNDGTTGYGAVPYAYNLGKYDVTVGQYVEFLNTKDPVGTNALGLYSSVGGNGDANSVISFNLGNAPGSRYSVIANQGNQPVTYVTWYDAIRFANWLNNGQGTGDTENGAYTLGALGAGGVPINGSSITRNAGAIVFLPSENEWYKAAYYNPATSSYFEYPTSSNTAPVATGPSVAPNSANYNFAVGNPTNVGAYGGTTSPYGAFDMGGNINQWNEALIDPAHRGYRGGAWSSEAFFLQSSFRNNNNATFPYFLLGFKVAGISIVPEPSTGVLTGLAFVGFAAWVQRWRKH